MVPQPCFWIEIISNKTGIALDKIIFSRDFELNQMAMIKRYLLSQKKVNSGRILTDELPFPLFTKAVVENKQLKSFEIKIGFS